MLKTKKERALQQEVDEQTRALKAAQQEILLQKEIAEGIIYGSPTPMFVIDKNHKVAYWNKACESLTGYTSEQMIGTDWQWKPFYPNKRPLLPDLIIDGDETNIQKLYSRMNLRRSPIVEDAYEAETFIPHLGKGGKHLYMNAAPIKDARGVIQGVVVTYLDFTERVRMTQEIRRREAFVQNLLQNSIDGIMATDQDGKIVLFNRSASMLLGYAPEEVIARMSYQEIFSRQTAREIRNAFYGKEYGPEGKILNMEIRVVHKEGEAIPVRFSGTLLYEDGKEIGSVVFFQDLREIRKLQEEKERAKRMAAVGETVAGVAHYIKNILNGLKGGAYVIDSASKKRDLDLMAKGWKIVEKNIDQIGQIVMDMLFYAKERRPRAEGVDPNELAMDILELMKERAEVSGVTVLPQLTPGLEKVPMDRTAIHHCLLNLVSNAIDACTLEGIMEGKGTVVIKTDRPEGWGVRFEVTDNGTGMEPETQKKLFSAFFSTKGYKGTGLGLPVTQKIAREHGGELSFRSDPGKGTTFTLVLP